MSVKGLTLPEVYLDLQVGKRRSFFVYQHYMGVVRRVETRLIDDRERERERERVMRERMEMDRMVQEARKRGRGRGRGWSENANSSFSSIKRRGVPGRRNRKS
jgi:dual specificity MAP kinase phosphatase